MLADRFLRGVVRPSGPDAERLTEAARWITSKLVPAPDTIVIRMKTLAERYVFAERPIARVRQLIEQGLQYQDALSSAALPAKPTWVEFPIRFADDGRATLGAMVSEEKDRTVMAVVVEESDCLPIVLCTISTPPMPISFDLAHRGHGIDVDVGAWFSDALPGREIVSGFLFEIMEARSWRLVRCSTRLGYRRLARDGASPPPLLEYRHVVIHLPRKRVEYEYPEGRSPGPGIPGRHHKLHRVEGFVRTYRKDRETPLVSYVPEHWRGDPELGIIIHERRVE